MLAWITSPTSPRSSDPAMPKSSRHVGPLTRPTLSVRWMLNPATPRYRSSTAELNHTCTTPGDPPSARSRRRVRARWAIEREKGGGWQIVVSEIPYGTPKGKLIEQIAGLVNDKKLPILADVRDRPRKLSHVVLNSPDRTAAFFIEQLGFRLVDQTKTITFLNCGSDHHSLALFFSKGHSVNHVALEMPDLDSVMSATGRMVEHGEEIGWGVGRHGPANNVFCYFVGPGGFVIEYTSDVEQIDDSYKVGGPDDWSFPNGRRDQWGLAKPTPRLRSAETAVGFSDRLFPG